MWHLLIIADVLVADSSAMHDGPGVQLVREAQADTNRHG